MDAAEFWFHDDDEIMEPKPLVQPIITRCISRMVRWRDGGEKKSVQECDRGARKREVEGLEADTYKKMPNCGVLNENTTKSDR